LRRHGRQRDRRLCRRAADERQSGRLVPACLRSHCQELRARRTRTRQAVAAAGRCHARNERGRSVMKVRAAIAAAVLAVTLLIPANAFAYVTWLGFTRQSNLDSTLTMTWFVPSGSSGGGPGYYASQSWRAGSGVSRDACWIGHGWLPVGTYDLWGHWDNYNGVIAGRVFYLQNKPCWNGTWRTELFVHSEETAAQGQYCPTAGDDPYCWEGPSDYYSNGCIKVSRAGFPSDLRLVHDGWPARSGDHRHGYFTIDDWLTVRDG